MLKFISPASSQSLQHPHKILLVCGLSVGNLPTLALDHLIASNSLKRVAFFTTSTLQHSVGYLPKDIESGALGLPAELYLKDSVGVLQFRSAARFGRKLQLAQEILENVVIRYGFNEVVVVGALPADLKNDQQILSTGHVYFHHALRKGTIAEEFPSINLKALAENGSILGVESLKDEEEEISTILRSGGSLAKPLLQKWEGQADKAVHLLQLFMFSPVEPLLPLTNYYSKALVRIVGRKELAGKE